MELDYLSHLYRRKHDLKELVREIDAIVGSHDIRVRCFPCYCTKEFIQRLEDLSGNDLAIKKDRPSSSEVGLYTMSFKYRDRGELHSAEGRFYLTQVSDYPGVYVVISLEESLFFNRGVLPFFRRHFPSATLTFITHKKLQNLLLRFRSDGQFSDFVISRASVRTRYEKHIVPSVTWPGFTLEKAFEWVSEQDGWFQSLTIQARETSPRPQVTITISRQGVITTDRFFANIHQSFLQPIQKTVYDNVVMFSQRSRRETKNRDVRPITITLPYDQFEDVKENRRFIAQMQKMRAASVSVIHGNPYVHLSLFDYMDGSAFDIWVLSANRIILVPQMIGTMPAIKRLVNHIFDTYAEGEIADYKAPDYAGL